MNNKYLNALSAMLQPDTMGTNNAPKYNQGIDGPGFGYTQPVSQRVQGGVKYYQYPAQNVPYDSPHYQQNAKEHNNRGRIEYDDLDRLVRKLQGIDATGSAKLDQMNQMLDDYDRGYMSKYGYSAVEPRRFDDGFVNPSPLEGYLISYNTAQNGQYDNSIDPDDILDKEAYRQALLIYLNNVLPNYKETYNPF